jgi:hypothetical protein
VVFGVHRSTRSLIWGLSMSSWARPGRDSEHGRDSGGYYGAQNRLKIGAVHSALGPPRLLAEGQANIG